MDGKRLYVERVGGWHSGGRLLALYSQSSGVNTKYVINWTWWHTLVIPTLGRWRWHGESEVQSHPQLHNEFEILSQTNKQKTVKSISKKGKGINTRLN